VLARRVLHEALTECLQPEDGTLDGVKSLPRREPNAPNARASLVLATRNEKCARCAWLNRRGKILRPCVFLNHGSAAAIFLECFRLDFLAAIAADFFANIKPARDSLGDGYDASRGALGQTSEVFRKGIALVNRAVTIAVAKFSMACIG
jgi:hypothetical protein